MMLDTWSGQETAYGRTARMGVLRVPRLGDGTREVNLGVVAKQNSSGVRSVRGPTMFDAFPGKIDDFGKWTQQVFEVPEGLVLRVKAFRSGPAHGTRHAQASLYIRIRETAAFNRIVFDATGGAGCMRTFYTVEGRFDVMDLAEITEQVGVIPTWLSPEITPGAIERTFRLEELQPAVAPKAIAVVQTVTNVSGEEVQVVTTQRRRMIKT